MIEMRRVSGWWAKMQMWRHRELWRALQDYLKQTKSTGCNMTDYWVLYRTIRRLRPLEVLECGTGVSTLVIAYALMENERETGKRGRVSSMDEHAAWLEMSRKLMPATYGAYVDFCLSGTCEDSFSFFRGMRYAALPDRAYDFVFVDGPNTISDRDGQPTCDFDFIHILRQSDRPMAGLIDKRVSTCFVYQQLLGRKFKYGPVLHLGYIAPVTRDVLGDLDKELSSIHFEASFRAFAHTQLELSPRP